jgi:hypothetical protein
VLWWTANTTSLAGRRRRNAIVTPTTSIHLPRRSTIACSSPAHTRRRESRTASSTWRKLTDGITCVPRATVRAKLRKSFGSPKALCHHLHRRRCPPLSRRSRRLHQLTRMTSHHAARLWRLRPWQDQAVTTHHLMDLHARHNDIELSHGHRRAHACRQGVLAGL